MRPLLRDDICTPRNLRPLGGFVGLELRKSDKSAVEVQRGIEASRFSSAIIGADPI